jgi:O-antigen/teichoic acid export membrane protein
MIRNLLYSLGGGLSALLLFGLFLVAARELGETRFGLFSYALAFVFIFEYLADFGVTDITIREVARARESARRYLANTLGYRAFLALLVYAGILLAVRLVNDDPQAVRLVTILGLSFILRTLLLSVRCFYKAFERFDVDTGAVVLDRLLLFGLGSVVVLVTESPEALAWTFVAVRGVSSLAGLLLLRRVMPLARPHFDWPFIRELQRQGLAIGGFNVVMNAMTYIDVIMLKFWRSYAEIGWYSAAYRIYLGMAMLPSVLMVVFAPALARLFTAETLAPHRALSGSVFRLYWPAACGLVLVGVAGARTWIGLAYGAEYAPAVPAFQILMGGLGLIFLSVYFNTILISINCQRRALWIALGGLALNVAVNLLVIPRWGYLGAAAATLLAEALIVGLFALAVRSDYGTLPDAGALWRPLAALGAGAPFLLLSGIGEPLRVLLALAAYLVALAALGVPSAAERRMLLARLGRRPGRPPVAVPLGHRGREK